MLAQMIGTAARGSRGDNASFNSVRGVVGRPFIASPGEGWNNRQSTRPRAFLGFHSAEITAGLAMVRLSAEPEQVTCVDGLPGA